MEAEQLEAIVGGLLTEVADLKTAGERADERHEELVKHLSNMDTDLGAVRSYAFSISSDISRVVDELKDHIKALEDRNKLMAEVVTKLAELGK